MISSIGFHTFEIVLRLTADDAREIYRMFKNHSDIRVRPVGKDKDNPNAYPKGYIVEYIKNNPGIKWYIRFDKRLASIIQSPPQKGSWTLHLKPLVYSIRAIINPHVLVGDTVNLSAATFSCLEKVKIRFNEEAKKISSDLKRFDDYSISRVDYCFNIDTVETRLGCFPEQLINLIKRADIPVHYTEWSKYDKISHRQQTSKNALYLKSNSVTINYYWKSREIEIKYPSHPNLKKARNLVRFEVQCKYRKMYSINKEAQLQSGEYRPIPQDELLETLLYKHRVTISIDEMLSDTTSKMISLNFFHRIIGRGHYLTLDCAKWMVLEHNFRQEKESRLIYALEQVNKCRSVAKAKAEQRGYDLDEFKRSLNDLEAIYINPVTIPQRWGITYIPNPLHAYYNTIYKERFLFFNEWQFDELLVKYNSL
ncbi:MAG: hypothetical protein FWE90_10465 [Defluviitaleaceae bacterium]|nr:hypothetical protein [Defluviitaleaceae bacterium]